MAGSIWEDCRALFAGVSMRGGMKDGGKDIMGYHEDNMVLCGSNSYEKKYYFNEEFDSLPESVKRELQIMCVWFTEECGGILTLEFEEDGTLEFKLTTSEYDGYHDEIGADLKIKQYRQEKRELLESLEMYYRVFYLGEMVGDGIEEDAE